mmetsp:Transcript_9532/g.24897  ORF Transcript_9532/g.24897 Transcript_9532/m.24897 type:complete len:219 (-) Transcript_9532:946-1602(-)
MRRNCCTSCGSSYWARRTLGMSTSLGWRRPERRPGEACAWAPSRVCGFAPTMSARQEYRYSHRRIRHLPGRPNTARTPHRCETQALLGYRGRRMRRWRRPFRACAHRCSRRSMLRLHASWAIPRRLQRATSASCRNPANFDNASAKRPRWARCRVRTARQSKRCIRHLCTCLVRMHPPHVPRRPATRPSPLQRSAPPILVIRAPQPHVAPRQRHCKLH